jgi:hypothetical protein
MIMNRFFLFLAVFSFAFFFACSDEKETRADFCKTPSKKCLVGEWRLEGVDDNNGEVSRDQGYLKLESGPNGDFYEFRGGHANHEFVGGSWSVDGTTIKITTDDGEPLSGTIILKDENSMRIKSNSNKTVASWYTFPQVSNPIEIFTYRGEP